MKTPIMLSRVKKSGNWLEVVGALFVGFVILTALLTMNNFSLRTKLRDQTARVDRLQRFIYAYASEKATAVTHWNGHWPAFSRQQRPLSFRLFTLFRADSNDQTQSAPHDAVLESVSADSHDTEEETSHKIERLLSKHETRFSLQAFPEYTLSGSLLKDSDICDPGVVQYSGYLSHQTSASKKHFFYWAFESRNDPAKDPVILWLNGGPGCSSLTGLFMELGPCTVTPSGNDTIYNPYSWTNNATVIFLDQPVGVGFSYGTPRVRSTYAAAEDVYAFLQSFYTAYPKFASRDFHIAGESYAGHFIPAIGEQIVHYNRKQFKADSLLANYAEHLKPIPLRSIMIGNGLTDPLTQYEFYPEMACNNSYGPVLTQRQCQSMTANFPSCQKRIQKCYNSMGVIDCVLAMQSCNMGMIAPYAHSGQNVYDVRRKCGKNPLCYDILGSITTYLNRPEVQRTLKVIPTRYQGCNMSVNLFFGTTGDWMKPFQSFVALLLNAGVSTLIYAGDADFICNWLGNRAWTLKLLWAGQSAFNQVQERPWVDAATREATGVVREYRAPSGARHGNFTFLRVFGAGHMVPYDQPASSLDMVNRWMQGRSFTTLPAV